MHFGDKISVEQERCEISRGGIVCDNLLRGIRTPLCSLILLLFDPVVSEGNIQTSEFIFKLN